MNTAQETLLLSLSCVCVCVKLSFSSLYPISILIQLFRCLEVVNTFCLSMIIRTRPRRWRQSELACQFVGGKVIYIHVFILFSSMYSFISFVNILKISFPFWTIQTLFFLKQFFSLNTLGKHYIYMKWYFRVEAHILGYISNYN